MRKFLFFFFIFLSFNFLFACNTKNYNTAYQDYYKNQKLYINAILDNNKKKEIKSLKELIQCGEYLHFNVNDYKKKLSKLTNRYIKIYSYNPLKIETSNKYKFYSIKTKKYYLKIISIYNVAISKPFIKKNIGNITLKIAQYKKNIVRIVYYSPNPINLKIKKNKNILVVTLNKNIVNKQKPSINNTYKPLIPKKNFLFNKKIIVIDPGHGGKDTGGIGIGKRLEKTAVLEIAKKVKYYLEKEGYKVFLTRQNDYFIPLQQRTHFANVKKASLFISIHCNIAPKHIHSPHGIETYFLSPARSKRAMGVAKIENKEIKGLNYLDQRVILNFLNKDRIIASNKLGIDIQSHILANLRKNYNNIKDGGVRPAPFWVLVGTQMPAVLIETGYLTNPTEARRLFDPIYQLKLAQGIAKGVKSYFIKNH